jgi:hypothetical protein
VSAIPASKPVVAEEPIAKYPTVSPKPALPPLVPSSSQPVVHTPPCIEGKTTERLATGGKIEPDRDISGNTEVEIINGADSDAAVRLMDNSTNATSRFVYIRSHDSYSIERMPPGTYSLLFELGSGWVVACGQFQLERGIQEYENPFVIRYGYDYSATLHAFRAGNERTKVIDRKRFLQGDQHFSLTSGGT